MSDNITIPATGTGTATPVVETQQQSGGQHRQVISLADLDASLRQIFGVLASSLGLANDPMSGRLRVTIDSVITGQTFTTVQTLDGGIPTNSRVFDGMATAWATGVRGHIT